jgi:hypothetical protein
MPNWCSNTVQFTGDKNNIETLGKLLNKTIDLQNKTGNGQLLFGLEQAIDGYMFDIYMDFGDDYLNLNFSSRWSPIPNDVVRIAELFNLTFTYDYEESGMGLHGKYSFKYEDGEGYLSEQVADEEDIDSCRFKEEEDEDDNETGFNYEKLESIIEGNPMNGVSITRVNELVS